MKRIIAISLALLTFAISLEVCVMFHFCGGKLSESKILLGYGTATCGMETNKNGCEDHSSASITKTTCCQDELQQIITDNYQPAAKLIIVPLLEFHPPIVQIYTAFEKGFELERCMRYRPPPGITSVYLAIITVLQI